jgi:hypothetical protein
LSQLAQVSCTDLPKTGTTKGGEIQYVQQSNRQISYNLAMLQAHHAHPQSILPYTNFLKFYLLKPSFFLPVVLLVLCEKGVQIVAPGHHLLYISLNSYYLKDVLRTDKLMSLIFKINHYVSKVARTPSVPIYLASWLWTRRLRRDEKGRCTEIKEDRDRDSDVLKRGKGALGCEDTK